MAHPDSLALDDSNELKTRCATCCFALPHESDSQVYWCTVHPTWVKLPSSAVHDHYCGQYMPEYLDEDTVEADATDGVNPAK